MTGDGSPEGDSTGPRRPSTPRGGWNGRPGLNDPRVVGRRPAGRPAAPEDKAPAPEPRRARTPAPAKAPEPARETNADAARASTRRRRGGTGRRGETPAEPEAPPAVRPASPPAARPPRTPRADGAPVDLAAEVEALRESINELVAKVDAAARRQRLGIFVDVPNLIYGAERDEDGTGPLDMGKLLDYLSEGRELVRATAYAPVSDNPAEPIEQQRFVAPFVKHAYRIVTKPLKRFADGSIKGNFDVELAVDMVTMAERLDVIALVSGDADFARAVELVQGRGVRVEVIGFSGSTAVEMRAIADRYIEIGGIAHRLRP